MLRLVVLVLISITYVEPKATVVNVDPNLVPKLVNVFMSCKEKTGVDSSILQKVLKWNLEDNEDLKKYLFCFAIHSGNGDSNGNLVKKEIVKIFDKYNSNGKISKIVDECNKVKGLNKFDKIFKAILCFQIKSRVLFKDF